MTVKPSAWILGLFLAGCGSDNADSAVADSVVEDGLLTPPEVGFQMLSIGTVIEPGEDVEYCEVGQVPGEAGEEILFSRFETAYSGGSHHLILFAVEPGSEADNNLEVGDILPCTGTHSLGEGLTSIGGAQQPYLDRVLPQGVGRRLMGGQKLVWNYHHLNTTDEPLDARHALNVHTVESIDYFARSAAFLNRNIDIPAGESAEFIGECTFNDDVTVASVGRHTHRSGTDFDVWFAGGDRDGEHIWTSTDFELDVTHGFSEPILMKAGEGFRFRCAYHNNTDARLTWGNKASDEMCLLLAGFWEAEPGQVLGRQSCIMESIDPDGVARGITIPDGLAVAFD